MTLEQLANTLPNGFHDSALKTFTIDYERRTVRLNMSLKVGDPDGPCEQRDDVREARIEISGVVFFAIDPPSSAAGCNFESPGELWIVDSYETRSIPEFTKTIENKLLDAVPADAFVQSFFVSEWNSYIHIAARNCSMEWDGAARHYEGPRQSFYPGETIDLK
jgi:hypothetical protein